MREILLEKIELLRQQMVKLGLECGLDHPDVLECSKQIDRLHNELLQMDHGSSKEMNGKALHTKPYRFYILENKVNFA